MTQSLTLPVAGLMTDPGPFTAAPEGGLVEAQNVVVLRPGVIEPRPGTGYQYDSVLTAGGYRIEAMGRGPSDVFVVAGTAGGSPWIIRQFNVATVTGPTAFAPGRIRFEHTGGRILMTSEPGVCTLPGQSASPLFAGASAAYHAGLPQPYAPVFGTLAAPAGYPAGANWLAAGQSVAYRVTLRRRLANGAFVESAPSGRVIVAGAGAGIGVQLNDTLGTGVYLAWAPNGAGAGGFNDLMAGDQLCIYRSPSSAGTPSDALRLRAVLTYDATYNGFTTIVNGVATPWFDGLADAAWTGEPLYTNATQESAGLANFRPEYARDVELYQGMTFYAGATTPQRLDLTLTKLGTTATVTDPQNAICSFAFTGDTTIATNTILNCTNIRFFAVGQIITTAAQAPGTASATFPAGTYVTAISVATNTVTLSANAGVTAAGVGCVGWDWISVDAGSGQLPIYHYAGVGTQPTRWFGTTAESLDNRWNGDGASAVQLRCTGVTQTEEIVCSFFQPLCTDIMFTVYTTKPLAWDKSVSYDVGLASQIQDNSATLRWSKPGEPEHCPAPYRTVVGDATSPIRRIIAARQSLLVFKNDGLFQVFGTDPGELQFELLDSTVLLLPAFEGVSLEDTASNWAEHFDDRVYAMTTRGPMAVTDAGATLVGAPILETLRQRQFDPSAPRSIMLDSATRRVGFFLDTGTSGYGLESTGYVLDIESGTWVTWTWPWAMAAFVANPFSSNVQFAAGTRVGSLVDQRWNLVAPFIDRYPHTYEEAVGLTCTINTVTGTGPYTVTIAAGSAWTPREGDIFFVGGSAAADTRTVTAVTSATVFETDTAITAALPLAGVRWGESFECRVVWNGNGEGNSASEKHWMSFALPFERAERFARVKYYFGGYRNPTTTTAFFNASTINSLTFDIAPVFKRCRVPTDIARDWGLKAGFTIRQAGCWFSTAGASLLYANVAPDKAAR